MIFKTTSHRSRDRVEGVVGSHPQYLYRWDKDGTFLKVSDPALIERLSKIPGVSKCRDQDEKHYRKCWSEEAWRG